MEETRWYAAGLRFECTGCGSCCTGSPGYVWVNEAEIEALALAIGQNVESFDETYVRKVGLRKTLREFPNGDCVFFDSEKRSCSVYDVRPRQCRTWPFWDSNLRTPESWAQTCRVCPGAGTGTLHTVTKIESARQVMRI